MPLPSGQRERPWLSPKPGGRPVPAQTTLLGRSLNGERGGHDATPLHCRRETPARQWRLGDVRRSKCSLSSAASSGIRAPCRPMARCGRAWERWSPTHREPATKISWVVSMRTRSGAPRARRRLRQSTNAHAFSTNRRPKRMGTTVVLGRSSTARGRATRQRARRARGSRGGPSRERRGPPRLRHRGPRRPRPCVHCRATARKAAHGRPAR
jgi:hypothetical protein